MVLDSVFIESAVVVYNTGHGSLVLLGDHPGFGCELAFGWSDVSGEEVLFSEVDHAIKEFLEKREQSPIDYVLGVFEFDIMNGCIRIDSSLALGWQLVCE